MTLKDALVLIAFLLSLISSGMAFSNRIQNNHLIDQVNIRFELQNKFNDEVIKQFGNLSRRM